MICPKCNIENKFGCDCIPDEFMTEGEKMEDLKISEDRKINLCDNCMCRNNMPLCTPDEEGVDFVFGDGVGSDNIIACRNYEGDHFD